MKGTVFPPNAVFDVRFTKHNWVGLYTVITHPTIRQRHTHRQCLAPESTTPMPCGRFEKRMSKPPIITPPTVTNPTTVPEKPVETPPPPPKEEPPANNEAITSVDGTQGDVAPYENLFEFADQPFQAASNTITYVGVTVANSNVPAGPSATDTIKIRFCDKPDCTGTVLATAEPYVNNYGLTTADIGNVTVVPGNTYYLMWTPPANAHGSTWLTFWHAGTDHIAGSEDTEVLIQGYNEGESHPNRRATTSYDGSWHAPAPHAGPFEYAYQNFKAVSSTITTVGVVLGNPALPRLAEATQTVQLSLCETPECANGALAVTSPHIFNYGITEASIGEVGVTEGKTYYLYWQSPAKFDSESWLAFWLGHSPNIAQASLLQAFVKGYDKGAGAPVVYHTEQEANLGANTFAEPRNASEEGEPIKPNTDVEVTCKLYAPQIESVNPQGYWYRVHSAPWDDKFYAAANTFWNGVAPSNAFEPIFTDYEVPTCPA